MNVHAFEEKIDTFARFFLYVLIFWIPFSNAAVEAGVILAFVLWVAKRALRTAVSFKNAQGKNKAQIILKGFAPVPSILNLPVAVFLYVCLLSALWSRSPLASLHGLTTKTFEWFVIYFLVLEFLNKEKYIKIAIVVFLFSAFSVCLDSFIQFYITGKSFFCQGGFAGRATSCFSTANDLGGYLLFPLILVLNFLICQNVNKVRKVFLIAVSLLLITALALTLSRGAWLAFFVGAWVLLFFRSKVFSYLLIIGILVLSIDFFIALPSKAKQHLRVGSSEVLSAAEWRQGLWEDSLKMIKDRPLLGHGPNTFMQVFQEKPYRRRYKDFFPYSPAYAHNCYVQMGAEVGLLGLGCFFWILINFFRNIISMIISKSKNDRNNFLLVVLVGLASASAGFLAHSFVDTHLYSLRLSALFWVMIGLSVSIYNLLSREANYDIKKAQPSLT